MRLSKKEREILEKISKKRWKDVSDEEIVLIKRYICSHCRHYSKLEQTQKAPAAGGICNYIKNTHTMRGCAPGIACVTNGIYKEKRKGRNDEEGGQ